jgi:uncharacterized protein YbaR (Trm112 family)
MRLPIPRKALVLEVGSGDSPCPRSDILFDLTLDSFERVGGRTVADRPLVLGNVERLPFRNKAFDYIIAFHILEHMRKPALFISELERVADAGYIETPAFWWERLNPSRMHRSEVGLETVDGSDRLVIHRKCHPMPSSDLTVQFARYFRRGMGWKHLHPEAMVTQYHWRDHIRYRILNPNDQVKWPEETDVDAPQSDQRPLSRRLIKWMANQRARRKIDLLSLLRCPDCTNTDLEVVSSAILCGACSASFPVRNGVPQMHPKKTFDVR